MIGNSTGRFRYSANHHIRNQNYTPRKPNHGGSNSSFGIWFVFILFGILLLIAARYLAVSFIFVV